MSRRKALDNGGSDKVLYTRPTITDFGSIAAHTFMPAGIGQETKNKEKLPGHIDNFTECSSVSPGAVANCNI
jgi:hypothetical protein